MHVSSAPRRRRAGKRAEIRREIGTKNRFRRLLHAVWSFCARSQELRTWKLILTCTAQVFVHIHVEENLICTMDYCIHPISGKERRCNLIVYLNQDWKSEYGGDLELWDETLTKKTNLISTAWNTAVIFKTNNLSYHGLPRAISCPEGSFRKSLAILRISTKDPRSATTSQGRVPSNT